MNERYSMDALLVTRVGEEGQCHMHIHLSRGGGLFLPTKLANAEKATVLEQLKSAAEWEAKLQEEVFQLTDDLTSSEAELKSAHEAISALES